MSIVLGAHPAPVDTEAATSAMQAHLLLSVCTSGLAEGGEECTSESGGFVAATLDVVIFWLNPNAQ